MTPAMFPYWTVGSGHAEEIDFCPARELSCSIIVAQCQICKDEREE